MEARERLDSFRDYERRKGRGIPEVSIWWSDYLWLLRIAEAAVGAHESGMLDFYAQYQPKSAIARLIAAIEGAPAETQEDR